MAGEISKNNYVYSNLALKKVETTEKIAKAKSVPFGASVRKNQIPDVVDLSTNCSSSLSTEDNLIIISNLKKSLAEIKTDYLEENKKQGIIGKAWNAIKCTIGASPKNKSWCNPAKWWSVILNKDNSSKYIQKKLLEAKLLIERAERQPEYLSKAYERITGKELSQNEISKIKNGKNTLLNSKLHEQTEHYKKSQENGVDVIADIASGFVSSFIYGVALAASPLSLGASIAIGVGASTVSGALVKSAIKSIDSKTGHREYDSLKYDFLTGGFNGIIGPITTGIGSAVTKTIASKFGIVAAKEGAEEIAEKSFSKWFSSNFKNIMSNKSYKLTKNLTAKNIAEHAVSEGLGMAVDGAIGGSTDNILRAALKGEDIRSAAINGLIGGMVMTPIIGGGLKAAAKFSPKAGYEIYYKANAKKLESFSETIFNEGLQNFESAKAQLIDLFPESLRKNINGDELISGRIKSSTSVSEKLVKKVRSGRKYRTIDEARHQIGDLIGLRLILDDVSPDNMGKVTGQIVDAIKNKKLDLIELNNYHGKNNLSYFSEGQIETIQAAVRHAGKADKSGRKIMIFSGEEAVKSSGYTTSQMNVKYNNGALGEFQIRGRQTNKIAELEHIVYDLRQGKNLSKGVEEVHSIYSKIEKAAKSLNRKQFKMYQSYLSDVYEHARKTELGIFPNPKPVLPKTIKAELGIESLKEAHNKVQIITRPEKPNVIELS